VQGARVPVADGLLARGGFIDAFERKGDFDELLCVFHITPFRLMFRNGSQRKSLQDKPLRL
jgi:hypothetical protein